MRPTVETGEEHSLAGAPVIEACEIYHDEIKDDGSNPVAHGFLIVPERAKQILADDLTYLRRHYGVPNTKINFKNLSGKKRHPSYDCARAWLTCLVDAMARKAYSRRATRTSAPPLGVRFSAIFMKSLHVLSDEYWRQTNTTEKTIRKFETLLRIGLTGGLRYLYSSDYRIVVTRFTTDAGAFHRPLNAARTIGRLSRQYAPVITLARGATMDSHVSHHRNPHCVNPDTATLLQLCDLALGSVSFTCLKSNHVQKLVVTAPLRALLDKRKRGAGFQNSSHFRTFSITAADIVNTAWAFAPLTTIPPRLPIADAGLDA